jgi:hypothetical protein
MKSWRAIAERIDARERIDELRQRGARFAAAPKTATR